MRQDQRQRDSAAVNPKEMEISKKVGGISEKNLRRMNFLSSFMSEDMFILLY